MPLGGAKDEHFLCFHSSCQLGLIGSTYFPSGWLILNVNAKLCIVFLWNLLDDVSFFARLQSLTKFCRSGYYRDKTKLNLLKVAHSKDKTMQYPIPSLANESTNFATVYTHVYIPVHKVVVTLAERLTQPFCWIELKCRIQILV